MDQLDPPEEAIWDERRLWFEEQEARQSRHGAARPSEQACALMIDLQAAFCAGAWSAVIILAAVVTESQVAAAGGRKVGPQGVPETAIPGLDDKELRWLHRLRNRLVHEDRGDPAITVEDQWLRRDRWESAAKRAVQVALAALYPPPHNKSGAVDSAERW